MANTNIKAVEARLDSMQATLHAIKSDIRFLCVMLGVVGLAIAAGPFIALAVH